jgi:cytochrome c
MQGLRTAVLLLSGLFLAAQPAAAQDDPAIARGRAFVTVNCSSCHAIGRTDPSPLPIAPPLRDLHEKYPIESLEEPLADGIITGHPTMPQFKLAANEIFDVITYLKSLEN